MYELPGRTFERNKTSFTGEVVSEVTVTVLKETPIEDVMSFLLDLKEQDQLDIYSHDQLPPWIPEDDQDLVDRVIQWSKGDLKSGSATYAAKHHPHLMNRIRDGMVSKQD